MTNRMQPTARPFVLAIPLAAALCLQAALPALAALPPEYQRVREFEAVLNSHAVIEALRYEPIEAVEYLAVDLYRVSAGSCEIEVRIVSDPAPEGEGWVGPRPFHVEVGRAICE